MADQPTPTVLILAGQRLGKVDPLAEEQGVEHKCFVPLHRRPLIGYRPNLFTVDRMLARDSKRFGKRIKVQSPATGSWPSTSTTSSAIKWPNGCYALPA